MDARDVDTEEGQVRVQGKGRRERGVYLGTRAADRITVWCRVRGRDPGPLVVPIHRGGHVAIRRLSPQAVLLVCRKRALQAGLRPFSPHDLRRTFVSNLLDAGVDIVTVASMTGHAHVTTPARYDRRPEETRQRAAGRLAMPPGRRS